MAPRRPGPRETSAPLEMDLSWPLLSTGGMIVLYDLTLLLRKPVAVLFPESRLDRLLVVVVSMFFPVWQLLLLADRSYKLLFMLLLMVDLGGEVACCNCSHRTGSGAYNTRESAFWQFGGGLSGVNTTTGGQMVSDDVTEVAAVRPPVAVLLPESLRGRSLSVEGKVRPKGSARDRGLLPCGGGINTLPCMARESRRLWCCGRGRLSSGGSRPPCCTLLYAGPEW